MLYSKSVDSTSNNTYYTKNPLPEDSTIRKVISSVPLIGIPVALSNTVSLLKKIHSFATESSLKPKAVEVLNHYRIASLSSKMLVVALAVTALSLGWYSGMQWIALAAALTILVGLSARDIYVISYNKKLLADYYKSGTSVINAK